MKLIRQAGRGGFLLACLGSMATPFALADVLPGDAVVATRPLRVCAYADVMPLSDRRLSGLENGMARLIAGELGREIRYVWMNRRGGAAVMLRQHHCDVALGVPKESPGLLTTEAYYKSAFALVSRRSDGNSISGFEDPALARFRIGVEAIGRDGTNTAPVTALMRRGLGANVVGFSLADVKDGEPLASWMVNQIVKGKIDAAILWGPFAGYYAKPYLRQLVVTPLSFDAANPELKFSFEISAAVRPGDSELKSALDDILRRRRGDIEKLLAQYAVPLLPSIP